ncbi:uncharacterized protein LOC121049399 isoform X2 [Rosa chinensis]|uniref:uncharacterized protein LOC121049399 isoform X2 n=1 Tax=Rosa chinensis TaxID=74649 RepID=UPI001AD8B25F|nr:uncharacterized protein LOC121049399 isoform X2 [Rosa chinensis]XP_040362557.1 uncharacterized protein LOC121049399 isoform X2 [Rosa chinensis]
MVYCGTLVKSLSTNITTATRPTCSPAKDGNEQGHKGTSSRGRRSTEQETVVGSMQTIICIVQLLLFLVCIEIDHCLDISNSVQSEFESALNLDHKGWWMWLLLVWGTQVRIQI